MGVSGRVRVVIIDDQAMIATMFRRLLEKAGVDVVGVAPSIELGLALVVETVPDVVVVDYQLPDGLGTEAAERIAASVPQARIVMASGSDVAASRESAGRAGCVAYVDKAAALQTLVPAVLAAAAAR